MLSEEETKRRDDWLEEQKTTQWSGQIYMGKGVSKADVERWLVDALDDLDKLTTIPGGDNVSL